MRQKMGLLVVALLGLLSGYAWVGGLTNWTQPAVARSTIMPAQPHIAYLAAPGAPHGLLTEATLQSKGVSLAQDWKAVQAAAAEHPLDALLLDATALASAGDAERAWVQAQMHEGLVVGGVGVDLKPLATLVGVPTLRDPGEADIPLGDDGYFLYYAYVVGKPEDVQQWHNENWLARQFSGETGVPPGIQGYTQASNGSSRGELSTEQGISELFLDLQSMIGSTYQMRADYVQVMQESAGENK